MHTFNPGDRVKRADVKDTSIPAYKAMRGTVFFVKGDGVKILWDGDSTPDFVYRPASDVVLAEEPDTNETP